MVRNNLFRKLIMEMNGFKRFYSYSNKTSMSYFKLNEKSFSTHIYVERKIFLIVLHFDLINI